MEVIASWPAQMELQDVPAWAGRAERLGFDVLHVPETIHDPFMVAALMIANTTTVTVRTSMVVAFPRSPMLTAYAAWDLVKLSGGRFQLGLASQVRGNIEGRYSTEWTEPVSRLRDYIAALRAIFRSFQDGTPLEHVGPHYSFTRLQPYFNPGPTQWPAPPIWTGGVNRGMCRLAGETSDGFVCHPTNSHPTMIRASILPALAEGRERAGRAGTGPALVVGPQPITAATTAGLAQARDRRRAELAFLYSTPAYRPQLGLFGLGDLGEALSAMAQRSDWSELARHVTDEVVAQLLPQGTYDELPTVLAEWYAGLCDGIVLGLPQDTADEDAVGRLVTACRRIPTTGATGPV